jgi:hypothetical protein
MDQLEEEVPQNLAIIRDNGGFYDPLVRYATDRSDLYENFCGKQASFKRPSYELPCLLHKINFCPVKYDGDEVENWLRHSLTHYGNAQPPEQALCIFCNRGFNSEDPYKCWRERMLHIAWHFEIGASLEDCRPDLQVLNDMHQKGCLPDVRVTDLRENTVFSNKRFACPFQKHDPQTYSIHRYRLCASSGWKSVARVK